MVKWTSWTGDHGATCVVSFITDLHSYPCVTHLYLMKFVVGASLVIGPYYRSNNINNWSHLVFFYRKHQVHSAILGEPYSITEPCVNISELGGTLCRSKDFTVTSKYLQYLHIMFTLPSHFTC